MFGQFVLLAGFLVVGTKTWSQYRNPFELLHKPQDDHPITECMHVVSEEGNYSFKKTIAPPSTGGNSVVAPADSAVCGLYVVADPNTLVEFSVKHMQVSCASGGLMAFVDGWELNGQYFPSERDHQLSLEQRVVEFCNNPVFGRFDSWTANSGGRTFRSHQNAALLQYRIPVRGAFVVGVRFVKNPKPCHILTEGLAPAYVLRNFGARSNCTLTALYPAVVEIESLSIGGPPQRSTLNFNCGGHADRLDIGGSTGLDSSTMQIASSACGEQVASNNSVAIGQAIFCGVTTVRLTSAGNYANEARIAIRPAGEADMAQATLLCDL